MHGSVHGKWCMVSGAWVVEVVGDVVGEVETIKIISQFLSD